MYRALETHADGIFPDLLIKKRRPSEPQELFLHRKVSYKAITMLPMSQVMTSLSKIRRSPDWNITFDDKNVPPSIIETETPEQYLTNDLPGYKSITNWAFGILLKQQCVDANAIIAVLPVAATQTNEYIKPIPIIFNSDHVLAYEPDKKFAVLQSRKKVNYQLESQWMQGLRFYYIDDVEVIIYEQGPTGYTPVFQQSHNLGYMPAFKIKAELYKQYDNYHINRSRINAMVPFLDEAACEYSDLQGSKVNHLFPLMYYYANTECAECSGAKKLPSPTGPIVCKSCNGTGNIKFNPFGVLQLSPPSVGQTTLPNPPVGYVVKDIAILDFQDKAVDKMIDKALSTINMQFINQTPLSISGDAKSVDKEELNNFVYLFAEDLVANMDQVCQIICDWRYGSLVPDSTKRKALYPLIAVPASFDILPSSYLLDEITNARKNNVNPYLLAVLEQELAEKKFYNEPEIAETVGLFFQLDPLPGVDDADKMTRLQNKGITLQDYVISNYMSQFIRRAVIDVPDFVTKTYDIQMSQMVKYAKEKMTANDTAQQMIDAQKQAVLDEMAKSNQPLKPGDPGYVETQPAAAAA